MVSGIARAGSAVSGGGLHCVPPRIDNSGHPDEVDSDA
jgi:hypothetical protein